MAHASSGELAAIGVISTSGMSMMELFGVDDDRAAGAVVAHVADSLKTPRAVGTGQVKGTLRATQTIHDGVTIHGVDGSWDLTELPSHRRAWTIALLAGDVSHDEVALFDGLGAAASGPDAAKLATDVIDSARHGGGFQPNADVAALLDASRARQDSAIAITDISALGRATGMPMKRSHLGAFTLGFADGAAHLRVTLATRTP